MELKLETLTEAMKRAMKAGDKMRTSVLRMLVSDVKNAQLAGEEIMDAVVRNARQLEKSIAEYRNLGKEDEAKKLEAEHEVVAEFLPQKPSDEELEALVDRVVADEGLASMKDFGRGMGKIMGEAGPAADGKKVQEILRKKLGGG